MADTKERQPKQAGAPGPAAKAKKVPKQRPEGEPQEPAGPPPEPAPRSFSMNTDGIVDISDRSVVTTPSGSASQARRPSERGDQRGRSPPGGRSRDARGRS